MSTFVTYINSLTGNYWLTVALCVALAQLALIPLELLSLRNRKAKAAITPEVMAIKKKYNANALGVSEDDDVNLSEELRQYTKDQRDEMMSNEVIAAYRKTGYRPFLGSLPMIATVLFIVLLYNGIASTAPEGLMRMRWATREGDRTATAVLLSPLLWSALQGLWSIIRVTTKAHKQGKLNGKVMALTGASLLASVILMVIVCKSTTVAVAFAILVYTVLQTVSSLLLAPAIRTTEKAEQEAAAECEVAAS